LAGGAFAVGTAEAAALDILSVLNTSLLATLLVVFYLSAIIVAMVNFISVCEWYLETDWLVGCFADLEIFNLAQKDSLSYLSSRTFNELSGLMTTFRPAPMITAVLMNGGSLSDVIAPLRLYCSAGQFPNAYDAESIMSSPGEKTLSAG
jgi:hypothetical protein